MAAYEIYEPYDLVARKYKTIVQEIAPQINKMKSILDEFKSHQRRGYVGLTLEPIVRSAAVTYIGLARQIRESLNHPTSRAMVGMTQTNRCRLESPIDDFKLHFYAPFTDIYKSFLRPKSIALLEMVHNLQEEYRLRGGNDHRFEQAFYQACTGLDVLRELLSFDAFDPINMVPSYRTVRYVVTEIFRFYNKMRALDTLRSFRDRGACSEVDAADIAMNRSFREQLHNVSAQLSGLSGELGLTPERITDGQPSPEEGNRSRSLLRTPAPARRPTTPQAPASARRPTTPQAPAPSIRRKISYRTPNARPPHRRAMTQPERVVRSILKRTGSASPSVKRVVFSNTVDVQPLHLPVQQGPRRLIAASPGRAQSPSAVSIQTTQSRDRSRSPNRRIEINIPAVTAPAPVSNAPRGIRPPGAMASGIRAPGRPVPPSATAGSRIPPPARQVLPPAAAGSRIPPPAAAGSRIPPPAAAGSRIPPPRAATAGTRPGIRPPTAQSQSGATGTSQRRQSRPPTQRGGRKNVPTKRK